jgi:serine/threonine protein kinase
MHPSLRSSEAYSGISNVNLLKTDGELGTGIDLYSLGVVILIMLNNTAILPISTNIEQIRIVSSNAAQEAFPTNKDFQMELSELLQKLLTIPLSLDTPLSCELPAVFRRLSSLAAGKLENDSKTTTRSSVAEMSRTLNLLEKAANSLTQLTAGFVVTPNGTELINPSDVAVRKAEAFFSDMRVRNRRTFLLAVSMTVTAFALVTGLILASVLTGIFTEKNGWAIAFGSAGAITAIGTLLWKPFDRIYSANILSNHIEFISIRTLTVLEQSRSVQEQRKTFDEALKELSLLLERHGGRMTNQGRNL